MRMFQSADNPGSIRKKPSENTALAIVWRFPLHPAFRLDSRALKPFMSDLQRGELTKTIKMAGLVRRR